MWIFSPKMKHIEKIYPFIIASFLSFVTLFFLKETFQYVAAFCLSIENSRIQFNLFSYEGHFEPSLMRSFWVYFLLYFSPLFFVIIVIEIVIFAVKKFPLGGTRHILLIFGLFHLGYLIIYIFYSSFVLILNMNSANDLLVLSNYLSFDETKRIIFTFFLIFILVLYMNFSTRRLLKYINP